MKRCVISVVSAVRWGMAFALALAAGASVSASAQETVEKRLRLEVNKGQRVALPAPAASVLVADPRIADVQVVSPRLLYLHGIHIGETSVFAVDAKDHTIFEAVIDVTHNISRLERAVKSVAPDADVSFRSVDGGMVMEGFASSPVESENIRNIATTFMGASEKMVNMVATAGSDQVMLMVKIVEMARTDVKKFGINLQNSFVPGSLALQVLQGRNITLNSSGIVDRGSANVDSVVYGKWASGRQSITGMVDALESDGLAVTLAEPSLTTTSGKTASFLVGGEFPIPVANSDGTVSIQYKPFGVSLNFTPVVLSKDRMSITVAPEVSTLNFDNPIEVNGLKSPIILTRKAESTVELGSGQAFALAGLLKNENSNSINKFPGLGDVPILGTLFRSQGFQNNQTELVIIATPYIVRPVSDHKLQAPTDGFQPANELDRILRGSLYTQQPMDVNGAALRLHGQGGYILD